MGCDRLIDIAMETCMARVSMIESFLHLLFVFLIVVVIMVFVSVVVIVAFVVMAVNVFFIVVMVVMTVAMA